jgi:hypothetical protein
MQLSYNLVSDNLKFLQEIRSPQKNKISPQQKELTPSTLAGDMWRAPYIKTKIHVHFLCLLKLVTLVQGSVVYRT